ncbi:MAG TPA: hypothetical protein VGJ26_02780 [Pirellulales bacterium]|jgi:hypothetical protein
MKVFWLPVAPALLALFLFAGSANAQIANPLSAFPVDTDGQYDGPEWSDITPAWFTSDPINGATPTFAGDPNANSLLFAGLAKDTPASDPELYLMYDYLGRTNAPTVPGELLGSVSFPLDVGGVSKHISVIFNASSTLGAGGTSFFDVSVDLHDGSGLHDPAQFGLEGSLGPGTTPVNPLWGVTAASAFHTTTHELIEIGVPLHIKAGFGPAFPPQGIGDDPAGGGGYSPLPAFWTSDITDNHGDPPASGGLFQINPDGSTSITPFHVPVPEPCTFVLGGFGVLCLWALGRKRS